MQIDCIMLCEHAELVLSVMNLQVAIIILNWEHHTWCYKKSAVRFCWYPVLIQSVEPFIFSTSIWQTAGSNPSPGHAIYHCAYALCVSHGRKSVCFWFGFAILGVCHSKVQWWLRRRRIYFPQMRMTEWRPRSNGCFRSHRMVILGHDWHLG